MKYKRNVKAKEGKTIEQTEYIYGFKDYVAFNADNHLIDLLIPSLGEAWDGHYFIELVEHDLDCCSYLVKMKFSVQSFLTIY